MSRHLLPAAVVACLVAADAGLLAGCAGSPTAPPVETLDERTGLTIASLRAPIELAPRGVPAAGRRPTFAYLGPVEWNRMGSMTQALWVQLVPGQGQELANIGDPAALMLELDDGELELHPAVAPALARDPYRPAALWGQSAYFSVTAHDLGRLAASSRLALRCHAADGAPLVFEALTDARPLLHEYLRARGLTGD